MATFYIAPSPLLQAIRMCRAVQPLELYALCIGMQSR
jgi:hypothetical protein